MKRACSNCKFFFETSDTFGECRKKPPKLGACKDLFPRVSHVSWCGDHKWTEELQELAIKENQEKQKATKK